MRVLASLLILCLASACSEAPPSTESQSTAAPAASSGRQVLPSLKQGSPYSGGVLAGDTLYLAGQTDADPATGARPEGVEARTRQAMDNVGAVLASADLNYGHLVNCRLQLADMDDYQTVNAAYASYFSGDRYPARTTVEVAGLANDATIEITCIGFRDAAATTVIQPPSDKIPPAMGPYSSAVMAGNTLYLSGQGGRDPLSGEISDQAGQQADRTLETIRTILSAADLSLQDVVTAYSFYPQASDAAAVNARLAAVFEAGSAPARVGVPVGRLPGDIAVEITFVAAKDRYTVTRLLPVGATPDPAASPAVLVGETLYLQATAGAGNSIEDQFAAIVASHQRNLSLADMNLSNVVYADVFVSDLADTSSVESFLREYFPENPPAATIIGVGAGAPRVSIGLIAAK